MDEMTRMFNQFEEIWKSLENNNQTYNQCILCTLIDAVAAQSGETGFDMMQKLLPTMQDVSTQEGILAI